MKNYVALGCSLTAQDGFINYINQTYNFNIENLAVSAGTNWLQIHRLNNLLINNQIGAESTLLWQITSPLRNFKLLPAVPRQFKNGIPFDGIFDWHPEKINLYGVEHTALLSNNNYFQTKDENFYYNMQTLICDIYKWSKIVKKIIVYLGWSSIIPNGDFDKTFFLLNNLENVEILPAELSICDWCKDQLLEFGDCMHPVTESYVSWGKEILVPVLLTN
jgi:hypothetical protein